MPAFTPDEAEFLSGHSIGRIATLGVDGDPHIVPLRYLFNPELETIELGGHGDPRTKRYYRNLVRTGRAAFLVDDFAAPGRPRAVEIRGRVEFLAEGGQAIVHDFWPELTRLWPERILAWGISHPDPYRRSSRKVS